MATNPRRIGESTRLIATAIRMTRAAKRMTQEDLSSRSGIPVPTLSKIEKALTAIDVDQLDRITQAFGQDMGDFVRRAYSTAELYQADGSLNPAQVTGYALSDEEMRELNSDDDTSDKG
ncbi:helix-turn-helix transcriptional regulator [Nocardia sp. NPDC050697]|uniref:helix-turn-helix domain-containing protein n=1 Tax=Nocardia sp. NPDC050697 TaxID=3155158 RepID=UPI0033F650D0